MRKVILVPLATLALLGLSACGNKAKNEAAEANEQVAGDSNTMGEAVTDYNAAENAAFGAAESNYDAPAGNSGEGSGDEIEE
jgi:predicted small lipoprotein YifL